MRRLVKIIVNDGNKRKGHFVIIFSKTNLVRDEIILKLQTKKNLVLIKAGY